MKPPKLLFYLDDDQDDLDFFKEIAESLGHRVTVFKDGYDLIQALRSDDENPDIIFLDIHMPILKGEEILDLIKKSDNWKHLPVVMVSGAYPKKLVRYFQDAGADYLLKRPLLNDYKDALEKVLSMDLNDTGMSDRI